MTYQLYHAAQTAVPPKSGDPFVWIRYGDEYHCLFNPAWMWGELMPALANALFIKQIETQKLPPAKCRYAKRR
tara:strand:+ start:273 stop:491 length:219 start_codon:yes stop_codon:yes gene_type:complete